MKFTIHDVVPYPRDEVYRVNRDDLPAIAPYLDRIESITVDSRTEEGSVTRIVNRWVAEPRTSPRARAEVHQAGDDALDRSRDVGRGRVDLRLGDGARFPA